MVKNSLSIRRLDTDSSRSQFDCGDLDLNEYFHQDSIQGGRELLSVTYIAEEGDTTVAYFSISNDSIRKSELERTMFDKILHSIPFRKRYSSMPAVKVGRLAVSIDAQKRGIGTEIMDFLKMWFTKGNKTGCRFIIVDAYNNEKTIHFYKKNGFDFLLTKDKDKNTRLMYFDLIKFVNSN